MSDSNSRKTLPEIEYTEIRRVAQKKHAKGPLSRGFGKAVHAVEEKLASSSTSLGGMIMSEPEELTMHPLEARMESFEQDLHRKVGFLHDSLQAFRAAIGALQNEVIGLHKKNRKLLEKMHPKQKGTPNLLKTSIKEKAEMAMEEAKVLVVLGEEKIKKQKMKLPAIPKIAIEAPKLPGFKSEAKQESPDEEVMRKPRDELTENEREILDILDKGFDQSLEEPKAEEPQPDPAPDLSRSEMNEMGKELLEKLHEIQESKVPVKLEVSASKSGKPILTPKEAKYVNFLRARYGLTPLAKSSKMPKVAKQLRQPKNFDRSDAKQ